MKNHKGFTLLELIIVLAILGILAVTALPKFIDVGREARIAAINSLATSAKQAVANVDAIVVLQNFQNSAVGWITMPDGKQIRMWGLHPDRWCDGIGAAFQGFTPPLTGCYLNANPVDLNGFTFYGYENTTIPNGLAGWRIESAPNPLNCSVQYDADINRAPNIIAATSGC